MAQNNIDKQIKDKLKTRELQPSANSWDRLDAMLTISEEKKSKKGFGWFFIAASIVIVFGIGFFLLNENNASQNAIEIPVVTNVTDLDTLEIKKNEKIIPFVQEQHPLVQVQNKKQISFENEIINQQSSGSSQQIADNRQQTTDNKKPITHNLQPTTHNPQPTTSKYVTAESLLAEVEQNKKLNTKVKTSSVKVNPNALLADTEKELNQTFREKAIESINKNYNALKAVVVNRNYE